MFEATVLLNTSAYRTQVSQPSGLLASTEAWRLSSINSAISPKPTISSLVEVSSFSWVHIDSRSGCKALVPGWYTLTLICPDLSTKYLSPMSPYLIIVSPYEKCYKDIAAAKVSWSFKSNILVKNDYESSDRILSVSSFVFSITGGLKSNTFSIPSLFLKTTLFFYRRLYGIWGTGFAQVNKR